MFGVVDVEKNIRISIRKFLDDEISDGINIFFAIVTESYGNMPVFHERSAVIFFIGLDTLFDGFFKC